MKWLISFVYGELISGPIKMGLQGVLSKFKENNTLVKLI